MVVINQTSHCVWPEYRRIEADHGPKTARSTMQKGRRAMRGLNAYSTISRFSATLSALWLCAAGSAWAGDGPSLGSLQSLLNHALSEMGVKCPGAACPQIPTVTQAALEVAAQFNVPTEIVRSQDNDPPAAIAANPPLTSAQSPIDLSTSTLTPLAFVAAQGQAQAQATPVGANSFFYAVTSTVGSASQPNTLSVIYEDGLTKQLTPGQHVADMTLPLVVLSGGGEREVPTTLQFFCAGTSQNCITATSTNAMGNFSGKGNSTVTADQIGLTITSSLGTSQVLSGNHLFIQVDMPLITVSATDPLYFKSVNSVVLKAFTGDETGFTPKSGNILGPKASIGIAPYAAPLCTPATCPQNSPPPSQFDFSFCARHPDGTIAVAAFAAIANSSEAVISTPLVLPEGVTLTCQF